MINQKKMCSHNENTGTIDPYTIRNITTDTQQLVISFQCNKYCDEDQNQASYKKIVGNILRGREVIIVTKQDQLKELISDAVDASGQSHVTNNSTILVSFKPHPESSVIHHATLLKEMPTSVAEDLASSTEFVYGNLWFLIPPNDTSPRKEDVMDDVRKLTPSAWMEAPVLHHEAVASPAMHDGLQILWFKANRNILCEQFAYNI